MAATEKIGATELSTYGLRLAKIEGNLDLPAFKQILDEHDFESNLLVLDEETIRIRLIGFYASKPALGTAIVNFQNKVRSALKQVWTFTNHDFIKTCVVKNGMTTMVYGNGVEIFITLTITA